jgi:hypothetical protein
MNHAIPALVALLVGGAAAVETWRIAKRTRRPFNLYQTVQKWIGSVIVQDAIIVALLALYLAATLAGRHVEPRFPAAAAVMLVAAASALAANFL